MDVGYTLVLSLSDGYVISVSSPVAVDTDGMSVHLSPEDDPKEAFEPVCRLVGQAVRSATSDQQGGLHLSFEGGVQLQVAMDPDYEAWQVAGPGGSLMVSTPGGELAVWPSGYEPTN